MNGSVQTVRLLPLKAAAAYLGISPWTLRRLAWQNTVPVVRLSRRLLFDLKDLDALVEAAKGT